MVDVIFSLCTSSTAASISKPRIFLESLEVSKQISHAFLKKSIRNFGKIRCEFQTAEYLVFWKLGPVSRKSRKLFRSEKPFVKLRPAYSVKLLFSYVVKRKKNLKNCKVSCLEKIQRELGHPKRDRKVSGLSRNGPLYPSAGYVSRHSVYETHIKHFGPFSLFFISVSFYSSLLFTLILQSNRIFHWHFSVVILSNFKVVLSFKFNVLLIF